LGPTNPWLGPTTPYSGVENGKFAYIGYTGVFNVLDYPAVSFPCGVYADKTVDETYAGNEPLSEVDAQIRNDCE
jgi:amidase